MARTKQTARKSWSGQAPRPSLLGKVKVTHRFEESDEQVSKKQKIDSITEIDSETIRKIRGNETQRESGSWHVEQYNWYNKRKETHREIVNNLEFPTEKMALLYSCKLYWESSKKYWKTMTGDEIPSDIERFDSDFINMHEDDLRGYIKDLNGFLESEHEGVSYKAIFIKRKVVTSLELYNLLNK